MNVSLYDPCHDPEPEGWESFRRAEGLSAIWAYEVIRTASEGSWSPPILAIFRDGGRVVGIAGAVYVGLRGPNSSRTPRPRREPLVLDIRLPAHSYGPTWHFTADVPVDTRREMLRRFEKAATRWLGWGLAGVVYRMVKEKDLSLVKRRGAIIRPSPGGSEMTFQWDSLDDWYASLDSNRRKSLRRRHRRINDDPSMHVEFTSGPRTVDVASMAELNERQRDKLQSRFDPRPPILAAHFAELSRRDDVSFLTYTEEPQRLLAFATLFHHKDCPQLGWWGNLPTEDGGRGHLYFDSYVRSMDYAIKHGATGLMAGRGALDSKQTVGFDEVPMSVVVIPRWAMR